MSRFYGILAVMGWIFTAVLLLAVGVWRVKRRKTQSADSDVQVARRDEKQP